MRAIDLYSGVGGWCLGLKQAGIEVVASYEWWNQANRTHNLNFGTNNKEVDIRQMSLTTLPNDIDIVVGSPPCTQFSFSNRGGGGDIADGLRDIAKFLEIVEYLSPTYWVMENIPRVAHILKAELAPAGRLHRFARLAPELVVVDMSEFGLPQSRKRLLAGRFPTLLMETYCARLPRLTLGGVVRALREDRVVDPLYNSELPAEMVTDNELEPPLTEEETRMNRESKAFHSVYNAMSFPDRMTHPARTVTATCTRVSRESIIVRGEDDTTFRRLTPRERASLQGFPITFQFYGNSYSDKLKLIGNALPPPMAYYVANAFLGIRGRELKPLSGCCYQHPLPEVLPEKTLPDRGGRHFTSSRSFWAAIPNLRFGSGVRFDLVNNFTPAGVAWHVRFYYGTSKAIETVPLDDRLLVRLVDTVAFGQCVSLVEQAEQGLVAALEGVTAESLQLAWCHRERGIRPFDVVDLLGDVAARLHERLPRGIEDEINRFVESVLHSTCVASSSNGRSKTRRVATWVFAGFVVGSLFNTRFGRVVEARNAVAVS